MDEKKIYVSFNEMDRMTSLSDISARNAGESRITRVIFSLPVHWNSLRKQVVFRRDDGALVSVTMGADNSALIPEQALAFVGAIYVVLTGVTNDSAGYITSIRKAEMFHLTVGQ